MDRLPEPDGCSMLVAATIAILTIPRVVKRVDALVVFHGMGETEREISAIRHWQSPKNKARYLLIAGKGPDEKDEAPHLGILTQPPFSLHKTAGVYCQEVTENTRTQSNWVVSLVRELGIKSLALFITPYHMVRAYMTLTAAFNADFQSPPVIPMPVLRGLNSLVPEWDCSMRAMVPGEVARIFEYQEKGDVTGFTFLNNYLDWLWDHPILANPYD